MSSRIKDFATRLNVQKIVSAVNQIIGPFDRRGEIRVQCLVEGAAAGNLIQPQGRLRGQTTWQSIGSALSGLIASASTSVDVKNFDEFRFLVTGRVAASATAQAQTLTPSAAPDAGVFKISYGGVKTSALAFDATAAAIQTALRLITGLEQVTVAGTLATTVVITLPGIISPTAFSVTDITLTASAVAVTVPVTITTPEVVGDVVNFISSGFYD